MAEFYGKIQFGNKRSLQVPAPAQVKTLEAVNSIQLYSTADKKNLYAWGLHGMNVKEIDRNDIENRCLLVSSKVTDSNDKLILPGDRLQARSAALGYTSVWGNEFTITVAYLELERTGDQKHFGKAFKTTD